MNLIYSRGFQFIVSGYTVTITPWVNKAGTILFPASFEDFSDFILPETGDINRYSLLHLSSDAHPVPSPSSREIIFIAPAPGTPPRPTTFLFFSGTDLASTG